MQPFINELMAFKSIHGDYILLMRELGIYINRFDYKAPARFTFTENTNGGARLHKSTVDIATLTLEGFARNNLAIIGELKRIFYSNAIGKMYYSEHWLDCECDININFEEYGQFGVPFQILFKAHFPYWQREIRTNPLMKVTPLFHFPFTNEVNDVFYFGEQQPFTDIIIHNAGDVITPTRITIVAEDGYLVNPSIYNETTGERIRIIRRLERFDRLVISNFGGIFTVTLNGNEALQLLDGSQLDFINLNPRINILHFDADVNVTNARATIEYNELLANIKDI